MGIQYTICCIFTTLNVLSLFFKDKVAALERAKNLRGTYIFLNGNYPEVVCQKREELILARKAARARGDIAYIRHDRLIVHPPFQKP
jgi:hypothetical protein